MPQKDTEPRKPGTISFGAEDLVLLAPKLRKSSEHKLSNIITELYEKFSPLAIAPEIVTDKLEAEPILRLQDYEKLYVVNGKLVRVYQSCDGVHMYAIGEGNKAEYAQALMEVFRKYVSSRIL